MCASCNLRVVSKALANNYVNTIPLSEVVTGSSRAKFKSFYCMSPEKFNSVFIGLKDSKGGQLKADKMSDAEALADYHDSKQDVAFYGKDFSQLLDKIVFTQEELNKTECNTAYTI